MPSSGTVCTYARINFSTTLTTNKYNIVLNGFSRRAQLNGIYFIIIYTINVASNPEVDKHYNTVAGNIHSQLLMKM
jgi:hypothetical protein